MLVNNDLSLDYKVLSLEEKTVTEVSPILELPLDKLIYLTDFLSLKDTAAMHKTCKAWKIILDIDFLIKKSLQEKLQQKKFFSLYQLVFEKKAFSINAFANSFFTYANVKQQEKFFVILSLEEALSVLNQAPEDLSRLGLSFDSEHITGQVPYGKRTLSATGPEDRAQLASLIGSKFKSLKEFSLSENRAHNSYSNILQSFTCCFENLTKLSLNFFISNTQLITKGVPQFIQPKNLQELKISCHGVQDATIYHILKATQQIKYLYFTGWNSTRVIKAKCSRDEELGDLKVKKLFIKLKEILPFNIYNFLARHAWLLKKMPDLEYLEIRNIGHLTDKKISLIMTAGNATSPLHVKLIDHLKLEVDLHLNEKEVVEIAKKRRIE